MKINHALRHTTAISIALLFSTAYAVDDASTSSTGASSSNTQASQPLSGKQKATAIGATTGAVAGAVVGGPVGAVVGAGVGGYVGHEGTDANGRPRRVDVAGDGQYGTKSAGSTERQRLRRGHNRRSLGAEHTECCSAVPG